MRLLRLEATMDAVKPFISLAPGGIRQRAALVPRYSDSESDNPFTRRRQFII